MAILSNIIPFISTHIAELGLVIVIVHFTRNYFTPGVVRIPGPFLAKISNVWRFVDVARGRPEVTLDRLHQEHGEYVRLGPKVVSVANLDALKTGFYRVQQQLAKGKSTETLFTTLDEDFHAKIKRPVSAAYSMSTVAEFEPFVDSTILTLFTRLDEFSEKNRAFDIAVWLQYYAFDVIGEMTFGKQLGFLEQGRDVEGIIASLEKTLDYVGKIGQMPWLDDLIRGGSTGAVARFARDRMHERLSQSESKSDDYPGRQRDFLTRFLQAKTTHPDIVDDTQVFSYTVSNVNAGSDTTAISLRAVLYYTLKHPEILSKLREELRRALQAGRITVPVSWKQSQELPYLDAVIKEALRLHSAVGLLLERVVPAEGLQLPSGPFLPAGTIVGVNPWIIHRHTVFGKEVENFIPERWLRGNGESETEFQARRQNMLGATLTFGAGPRTCIGKNISLLEIYKLIPSLLLAYEVELTEPEAEWEVVNAWFVRQKHMNVKVTRTAQ
ncbi:cytochrome P450 [Aspergillus sclerotioniger CBS 115572]|uniref:Cytochrome P450 n=1 Tax=Aspergillus sclerotioniger CBS 115572 TaxID=1450535 RepID=A0A317W862_9EURO|nr:cytochrome P450 [Aspergillus sclerotioniger CBS 115572]PWY80340.1 cytochrome P450 [Aspergillus sclerotioniger CBS 115572]